VVTVVVVFSGNCLGLGLGLGLGWVGLGLELESAVGFAGCHFRDGGNHIRKPFMDLRVRGDDSLIAVPSGYSLPIPVNGSCGTVC